MDDTKPRYNQQCPAHEHTCWTHRNLMREDDLVCTKDYKRLPKEMQHMLWRIRDGRENKSALSIVVDWLLDNLPEHERNCKG